MWYNVHELYILNICAEKVRGKFPDDTVLFASWNSPPPTFQANSMSPPYLYIRIHATTLIDMSKVHFQQNAACWIVLFQTPLSEPQIASRQEKNILQITIQ